MSYKNIPNVEYKAYRIEGSAEADVEGIGRVDEMFIDDGKLHIGLEGPENEYHSIDIPVLRGKGWDNFVKDLVGTLQ